MAIGSAIAGGLAAGAAGTLLGGARGGGGGTGKSTRNFTSGGGLFDSSFQRGGKETKNGQVEFRESHLDLGMDPRLEALSNLGIGGANQFLGRTMNNPNALFAEDLGMDFLGQLGATDPMEVAQNQFNLLNPILQQGQQEDFLGMENRLFSQGRLGGGGNLGGSNQLNALFDSQADAERKLLFDSLNQGLNTQSHLFNLGSGLNNLGQGMRTNDFNLGQGFLNIPLQLQEAMNRNALTASGMAFGSQMPGTPSSGFNPIQAVGAGLLNSGIGQLDQGISQGIGNIFNGGGNFGPGGGSFGNTFGGIA